MTASASRLSLSGRVFSFHGFSRASREQWTHVLLARGAAVVLKWTAHSGALVLLTDVWVDVVPTGRDVVSVTEFWLRESLKSGRWLDFDAHPFFRPPPRTAPGRLSYPIDYDVSLQDGDHWRVLMPCSPRNLFEEVVPLWPYIAAYLQLPTTNTSELSEMLKRCTGVSRYTLNCLEFAIEKLMDSGDRASFFTTILPTMKRLVLQLPFQFENAPVLLTPIDTASLSPSSGSVLHTKFVEMNRLQILPLLCAMFFSVFPAQEHAPRVDFPWFNMGEMFSAPRSMRDFFELKAHKIRTILEYFLRVIPRFLKNSTELQHDVITFTRVAVQIPPIDATMKAPSLIKMLAVSPTLGHGIGRMSGVSRATTLIEDLTSHLQIDFANKYAGGGVMNGGAVQEEIRFILSPELMVACLVFAKLEPHESFVIHGSERFSTYTGYGGTFRYAGSMQDTTPFQNMVGPRRRRQSVVIGIDAISYSGNNVDRQYSRRSIMRDLVKALVGFSYPDAETVSWPVATGNWGCGVFRGDPELKFLIQWLAATLAGRDLVYVNFDQSGSLHTKIDDLMGACLGAFRLNYVDSSLLQSWILEFMFQLESTTSTSSGRNCNRSRTLAEETILERAKAFVCAKKDAEIKAFMNAPTRNAQNVPSIVPTLDSTDQLTPSRHRTSNEANSERGGLKQPKITDFWRSS